MEAKSNKTTSQRLQERILDAPFLEMDLVRFIEQIKGESTWKEGSHNSITLFKSNTMRIVLIGMHKNFELKTHTAPGFISVQVLEGCIEFIAAPNKSVLKKGQMVSLYPQIPHSAYALEESFFLLTLAKTS